MNDVHSKLAFIFIFVSQNKQFNHEFMSPNSRQRVNNPWPITRTFLFHDDWYYTKAPTIQILHKLCRLAKNSSDLNGKRSIDIGFVWNSIDILNKSVEEVTNRNSWKHSTNLVPSSFEFKWHWRVDHSTSKLFTRRIFRMFISSISSRSNR